MPGTPTPTRPSDDPAAPEERPPPPRAELVRSIGLAAASGAAFAAVVFGQVANAFACRSTVRPVWRLGWRTNRLP